MAENAHQPARLLKIQDWLRSIEWDQQQHAHKHLLALAIVAKSKRWKASRPDAVPFDDDGPQPMDSDADHAALQVEELLDHLSLCPLQGELLTKALSLVHSTDNAAVSKRTRLALWLPEDVATWLAGLFGPQAALLKACRSGKDGVVRALLSTTRQIGPAQANDNNSQPLLVAAGAGHPAVCRTLLQNGAMATSDILLAAAEGRGNERPVEQHQAEVVQLLLQQGVDPTSSDYAAFKAAVRRGWDLVARVLLEHPQHPAAMLQKALKQAAAAGHAGMCALLAQYGAKADAEGSAALLKAAANNHGSTCRVLLSRSINGRHVAKANASDSLALKHAAKHGDFLLCVVLLDRAEHGDFAARANAHGSSALAAAAANGHIDICQLLMAEQPYKANASDSNSAPLAAAAAGGHWHLCGLFLFALTDPAKADDGDSAALIAAVRAGDLPLCRELLRFPSQPAKANAQNSLALVLASEAGRADICDLLLTQPADPARPSDRGSVALEKAAAHGHMGVCQMLVEWPTHPATPSAHGSMALKRAAGHGHLRVVSYLHSADTQHSPMSIGIAYWWAVRMGHADVTSFIEGVEEFAAFQALPPEDQIQAAASRPLPMEQHW